MCQRGGETNVQMIVFPPSSQLMIVYPHEKKISIHLFFGGNLKMNTRENENSASRNNFNRVTIWFVQQEADKNKR